MKTRSSLRVMAVGMALFLVLVGSASAENRWIRVINESSSDIWRIYGTSSGDTNWGRDRLGTQVLESGYNIKINFDDGSGACIYDLKAETRYGSKYWTRMRINVCTSETWTLTD